MKEKTGGHIDSRAPRDRLQRPIHDLRISLIDRCNLRCTYCMPAEVFGPDYAFLPPQELLDFEEIVTLVRAFVACGVRKIRLTGGEPLLRRGLADLVARIRAVEGVEDIALTTNGLLLGRLAGELKTAGLDRLNVSLDALDPIVFRQMAGGRGTVERVLEGIDAAAASGFPVKVNMVVERRVNESQILPMAHYFRQRGHDLRFIEFMDVGNYNQWSGEKVVAAASILALLRADFQLAPVDPAHPGEVAKRYRYADAPCEVGFITSISEPFCGDCSRARISAEGKLYTCLFGTLGYDFKAWLRQGHSVTQLSERIATIWGARDDRYSELRAHQSSRGDRKVEMSYIGG